MKSCEILRALDSVAAVSGKLEKSALLTTYLVDPTFQRVMKLMLNPLISFYKRPARSEVFGTEVFTEDTWLLLDRLATRQLSGDAASREVQSALSTLTPESSELLWRVLHRDPRAGFSEGSINKILPLTIPEVPYMRCSLPSDVDLESWPWVLGVYLQEKADGTFFALTVKNGGVTVISRSGFEWPLELYGELGEVFATFPDGQYHGEMLVEKDGVILPREIGNGMLTSVNKGTPFQAGCTPVPYLWDVVPLESLTRRGTCLTPYSERFSKVGKVVEDLGGGKVKLIQTQVVYSLDEAYAASGVHIRNGKEGAVIKHPDGPWRDTGSSGSPFSVKIKMEAPAELRVKGLSKGKGKNAKTFGALECVSECGMLEVNISGFSDELRLEIFNNPERYIDSIIKVTFNDVTKPNKKTNLYSLFLPRFGELRPDRTTADDVARIIQQLEDAKATIGMIDAVAA
ncbi:DNA ligase [Pseudomonas veronii 1YdBTEX2]|uniref:DNA ligase n=1 Tax=Pseudomonas veronii 1YdBTEX2 TaxID=1295141 RepID=A0A1D3K7L4_PSEVE|nr:DNA ligase [Pseudomonas veronii 1YdBTEX2]